MADVHATKKTHGLMLNAVNGRITDGGPDFQNSIRGEWCVSLDRNPQFRFIPDKTDVRQPLGHWLIDKPSTAQDHLEWNVKGAKVVPALSLDPNVYYMHGEQRVTEEGEVEGHLHLHIYQAEFADQIAAHFAGENVPLPDDYIAIGGKPWYTTVPQADGSWNISAQTQTKVNFRPGKLYIAHIRMVHIDDTEINTVNHLELGGLTTVFEVRG